MLKNAQQIGTLIKQYRIERNLSQADLARDLEVTISAVSTWERGISKPGIDVLYALAQAMNLTLDELLTANINHQALKGADAFLEHLDYQHANLYIINIATEGENLRLSCRITGPELSPKGVESKLTIKLNDAPCEGFDTQLSKKIPPAEEMMQFHAVDVTCTFPYQKYDDAQLLITYEKQSYALTIAGTHIKLIDIGPAMDLKSMKEFGELMSSKDFQIAFQFLAQNGHFKKLETNMQSMIAKITS